MKTLCFQSGSQQAISLGLSYSENSIENQRLILQNSTAGLTLVAKYKQTNKSQMFRIQIHSNEGLFFSVCRKIDLNSQREFSSHPTSSHLARLEWVLKFGI